MEVKDFSQEGLEPGKDDYESDEVVFESDVYLSQTLSQSLCLFHYPTTNRCFDAGEEPECLSARIKPRQKKLEMEVGINTHSGSYDKSRGEQMAYNVDGQNPTGEPYFQSSRMDKYSLTGAKADKSTENYVVGFMKNGELHLTPLLAVMELRPGFVHMDKMDSASKKAQNPDEEEGAEEEEAVAVTVRFEGPNAERDRLVRQKSFQYVQQRNASEPWVDVRFHAMGTSRSLAECEKLACSQTHRDVHNESVTSLDYVKELLPECYRLSGYSKEDVSHVKDPNQDLNLSDHIKQLFISAHVLTLPMLMEKLPMAASKADVLQRVPQFAVLVQGCWAAKSELLYQENSVSPYSGMTAKLLINARDYVMWLFTKSKYITCKEVLKVIYIPDADFQGMVSPMAVKDHKRWKFKFGCDEEFLRSHPAVAQSQELKWGLRYQNLVKDLKMRDAEGDSPKGAPVASGRPRQKRPSRSSVSEGDESDTAAKDAKRQYISKRRLAPPSPSKGASSKPRGVAHGAGSPSYPESSLPPPGVVSELAECLGEALRQRFCMTLGEVREMVIESGRLCSLAGRADFEGVVDEAMAACGAQKLRNKWPQYTIPEPLYAFAKFGNKLDRYRCALLELFSTTARARTNLFVKKVEDELREIVSEADCRQIFEEYCIHKSGFFYLKGTISPDPPLPF